MDDPGVTGMHMTKSPAMMMGSKPHLKYLLPNHTGLDSKFRWTGTMMGMEMDFTVQDWLFLLSAGGLCLTIYEYRKKQKNKQKSYGA